MRRRVVLFCTLILVACGLWLRVGANVPPADQGPTFLYTAASKYDELAWLRGAERFPSGAHVFLYGGSTSRPLVPGFAANADPSVSFDGTRVLFAGKEKPGDRWQIYEVSAAGGNPRKVTSCGEGCVRPFYLPEDRLVYASLKHSQYILETAALDGSAPRQLTYAPGHALPTDVLRDGRVLFEAQFPLGSGKSSELYTVYTDGSGVESYRCDHDATASRYGGRQASSGDIVFIKNSEPLRFTSALAHEVPVKLASGQLTGDVAQYSQSQWLVSSRADSTSRFAIARVDTNRTAPGILVSDPAADLVQPVVLRPQVVPNRHPSGLHEWPHANLLALNVYTSKLNVPKDSVASVRVYTATADGKSQLLGSSPVEPDGSFFVQVPGDKPLQFELLDKAGKTVQREHGWFWARAGEQRICVGCHAGPERAPDNAVPGVLLKSTEPVALLGTAAHAQKGGR